MDTAILDTAILDTAILDELIMDWCDEHLPELYDTAMFDNEEIADEVWNALDELVETEILPFVENASDIQEQISDAAQLWFTEHHDIIIDIADVPIPPERINAIRNKPQIEQHTAEWYSERRNCLSASEFRAILCGSRGALLRSKIAPEAATSKFSGSPIALSMENGDMNPTVWGHRFESVVRDIYELEIAGVDTVCDTLGRLTHSTIPWLRASPDGLVIRGPLSGRLIEIKAPKTRVPGDFVPIEYWIQMQIQAEVVDLEAVDFIEAQFKQKRATWIDGIGDIGDIGDIGNTENPDIVRDRAECASAKWKGRIRVYGHECDSSTWVYRYTPPVEDLDDATFTGSVIPLPSMPLLEDTVWWLHGWFPRTVLRNRQWWEDIAKPAAEQFWADVELGRAADATTPTTTTTERTPITISRVQWMGRD